MPGPRRSGTIRAMSGAPDERDRLLARLSEAMDEGRVAPADVERLLSRRPARAPGGPTAAGVLYALGAVVVFCGLGIAYGTIFGDLPEAAQVITPYVFPLVALVACALLARRGGPSWQTDLAGLVGYVAFGIAVGVSGSASGWLDTGREVAAGVVGASIVAVVVVLLLHRVTGSERLLWVGMPAALAALGIAAAHLAGLWSESVEGYERLGWVILAEAGVAAAVAAILARRDRTGCLYASIWAALGGYAAVVFSGEDLSRFTVWHVVLGCVVIATFVAAAALDVDLLIWIGAVGGAFWVMTIALVVGSATGAALAVVLAGLGLVGLGVLVARLLRAPGTA